MAAPKYNRATLIAAVTAALLITVQIAAKAARDAMFLGNFGAEWLPAMVFVSALASLSLVFPSSSLMSRFGPNRVLPIALFFSAGLFGIEWLVGGASKGYAAILLYLHIAALGAVLISGFWSLVSEAFDPRSARDSVATISTGATLGGLMGGVLADRFAVLVGSSASLAVLACIHLACALLIFGLKPRHHEMPIPDQTLSVTHQIKDSLKRVFSIAYLRNLALMVLFVTISATLIDYVFKHSAAHTFSDEADLMQFFAKFYAGIGIATFLVQTIFVRHLLRKIGLARTIQAYPVVVTGGLIGSFFYPGLAAATLVRGSDSVLQSSVFKSGYELMYAPIPPQEKRAAKPVIDVGFERIGDMIGAAIVQLVLFTPGPVILQVVVAVALGFTVGAIFLSRRLHAGYLQALESGLRTRANELEIGERDGLRTTLLQTMSSSPAMDLSISQLEFRELVAERKKKRDLDGVTTHAPATNDDLITLVTQLRSGDAEIVREALNHVADRPRETVPYVVDLLAWDEIAPDAAAALREYADHVVGYLVDVLTDPEESFAIRRRLPHVLSICATQRAADGLNRALEDRRFEVRYRAGVALSRIADENEALTVDADALFDAIRREVAVDRTVWAGRTLLDSGELDENSPFAAAVKQRDDRSLEHIFNLLSLAFDRDTLLLSYQGLLTEDELLRGLALEYLDSILPTELLKSLRPILSEKHAERDTSAPRPQAEIAQDLMASRASIELNLESIRKALQEQETTGET